MVEKVVELTNIIDHIKHQHYLSSHLKDDKFPLDGSDWARMVAMRLRRQSKRKSANGDIECNFWFKIHSKDSPLFHERKEAQRSMNHWFNLELEYHAPLVFRTETNDPVWQHLLQRMSGYVDGWTGETAGRSRTEKWASESNSFWVSAEREGTEGAGRKNRRLLSICQQK